MPTHFGDSRRWVNPCTFRGIWLRIRCSGRPGERCPRVDPRTRSSRSARRPSTAGNCAESCWKSGRSSPAAFSCRRAFSAWQGGGHTKQFDNVLSGCPSNVATDMNSMHYSLPVLRRWVWLEAELTSIRHCASSPPSSEKLSKTTVIHYCVIATSFVWVVFVHQIGVMSCTTFRINWYRLNGWRILYTVPWEPGWSQCGGGDAWIE